MDWNLSSTKKDQFLDLLNNLGSHSVYPAIYIQKKLLDCGVPVQINEIGNELLIGSVLLKPTTPEFGEPGIYAPLILQAAIDDHGFRDEIVSKMSGRGFYFRDCLEQLASKRGIKKDYL